MAWTLRISETAKRQLKKLDRSTAQILLRYLNRVLQEAEDPRQRGKALTANLAGLWRYRIGDYQVICQIEEQALILLVVKVGHRSDVYELKIPPAPGVLSPQAAQPDQRTHHHKGDRQGGDRADMPGQAGQVVVGGLGISCSRAWIARAAVAASSISFTPTSIPIGLAGLNSPSKPGHGRSPATQRRTWRHLGLLPRCRLKRRRQCYPIRPFLIDEC
ncbi:MAG: type II toxin-antitoxin system RelE family toxin [Cyanobium sp.]